MPAVACHGICGRGLLVVLVSQALAVAGAGSEVNDTPVVLTRSARSAPAPQCLNQSQKCTAAGVATGRDCQTHCQREGHNSFVYDDSMVHNNTHLVNAACFCCGIEDNRFFCCDVDYKYNGDVFVLGCEAEEPTHLSGGAKAAIAVLLSLGTASIICISMMWYNSKGIFAKHSKDGFSLLQQGNFRELWYGSGRVDG